MAQDNDLDAQLLDQMRDDFLDESQEILDRMGPLLTQLEKSPSAEVINSIFREVHTLKGTAAFVGLESIRGLAHRMEDVFDALRTGQLTVTPELIDVAFSAVQLIGQMRTDILAGGTGEADIQPLLAKFEAGLKGKTAETAAIPVPAGTKTTSASASSGGGSIHPEATLRVETQTVDTLMLQVGELITARNSLQAIAERLEDAQLTSAASSISRLITQTQTTVSSMRLVPIERLFSRFVPVARNLARERGKQVKLIIEGGDTLFDRTVAEQMYDPLTHLIRNAIDHGIETTEERRRDRKPPEGILRLAAERRGDEVILHIADDGRGLNAAQLRAEAVKRGSITDEEASLMSDEQAFRLIFAAGFSTATTVTETSGRGVGLDVVIQNVRRLRGSVDIQTMPGKGTTFVIQLPLTLAILQVLLVRAAGQVYALPLHIVRDTLQLEADAIQTMQKGEVAFIRDVPLPVRRPQSFGLEISGGAINKAGPQTPMTEKSSHPAVVVHLTRGDEVLMVDELLGKQQMVIKPLSPYLGTLPGVEGAAILPDGSVTLVLDVEGLAV